MSPPSIPNQDESHLKLLSIFHYVMVGYLGLEILILVAHFVIMNTIMLNPEIWKESGNSIPPQMAGILRAAYLFFGILLIAEIVLNVFCARDLKVSKNRALSFVASVTNCLHIPLGTILGIFTIIVLMRPTVIERYQRNLHQ